MVWCGHSTYFGNGADYPPCGPECLCPGWSDRYSTAYHIPGCTAVCCGDDYLCHSFGRFPTNRPVHTQQNVTNGRELPPGKVLGHFDVVDKKKAKEIIGDIMCFWGNVPPGLLIAGTPQAVKDYVRELIDIFGDNGGLIVDGAVDGIPPESKPENVEAMVEAVFEYGVY